MYSAAFYFNTFNKDDTGLFGDYIMLFISNILQNKHKFKKTVRNPCLFILFSYFLDEIEGDFSEYKFKMKIQEFLSHLMLIMNNNKIKELPTHINKEYNPVCSIMAGIISQEVLKVITNKEIGNKNLYTYNSRYQQGIYIS